ncbi:MAG: hypothetical protein ACRCWS_03510 [Propionibacteriaceae bacterium]
MTTALSIDCDTCAGRGPECQGCVMSFFLGEPGENTPTELSREEQRALAVLAESGLLPRLTLVRSEPEPVTSWAVGA